MLWRELLLLLAATAAGAINSVAGGGTLLTFPSLLAAGALPLTANATSSVALVPGALSSFYGYRREVAGDRRVIVALCLPSLVGGWAGAELALWSSDRLFARLVPWLILAATVLFMLQDRLRARFAREGAATTATTSATTASAATTTNSAPATTTGKAVTITNEGTRHLVVLAAIQLVVAIYGGYFGAGMGILMLAALGIAGETNLHRMNALKSIAGACINGAGTVTFILGGRVQWRWALIMAVGAIIGGFGGAGIARRIGTANVKRLVIAIGLWLTADMLYHQLVAGR